MDKDSGYLFNRHFKCISYCSFLELMINVQKARWTLIQGGGAGGGGGGGGEEANPAIDALKAFGTPVLIHAEFHIKKNLINTRDKQKT